MLWNNKVIDWLLIVFAAAQGESNVKDFYSSVSPPISSFLIKEPASPVVSFVAMLWCMLPRSSKREGILSQRTICRELCWRIHSCRPRQVNPGQLMIVYNFQITDISTILCRLELIYAHGKNEWRKVKLSVHWGKRKLQNSYIVEKTVTKKHSNHSLRYETTFNTKTTCYQAMWPNHYHFVHSGISPPQQERMECLENLSLFVFYFLSNLQSEAILLVKFIEVSA